MRVSLPVLLLVLAVPLTVQARGQPAPPADAPPPSSGKAEAEQKKKLEREEKRRAKEEQEKEKKLREQKAKEERQRARDEKEKEKKKKKEGKGAETPAPVEPPPAPVEPPPPPVEPPPPPPPPPAIRPAATPVDSVGGARWTGMGFVQPGQEQKSSDAASSNGVSVPAIVDVGKLNVVSMRLGLSKATFNPINDDRTDDETAFSMLDADLGVAAEFRNVGQLLVPWFDFDFGFAFGNRKEEAGGATTSRTFKVFTQRVSGMFGMDLGPVEYFSAGPYVGYRLEMYSVSFDADSSTSTAKTGIHHGLQYGLHARVRTRAKAKEPSRLFGDFRYEFRAGEYQTATYAVLQAGVRAGIVYFTGWYEKRLGSSGGFTPSDVADSGGNTNATLANATAASSPIEQRLGGGILISFF